MKVVFSLSICFGLLAYYFHTHWMQLKSSESNLLCDIKKIDRNRVTFKWATLAFNKQPSVYDIKIVIDLATY